jgi:hypothetical protein
MELEKSGMSSCLTMGPAALLDGLDTDLGVEAYVDSDADFDADAVGADVGVAVEVDVLPARALTAPIPNVAKNAPAFVKNDLLVVCWSAM